MGFAVVGPQLEDQRLAGARWSMDHHIPSSAQSTHGLLLPQVWNDDLNFAHSKPVRHR